MAESVTQSIGHQPANIEFFAIVVKSGLKIATKKLQQFPLHPTLAEVATDIGLRESVVGVLGKESDATTTATSLDLDTPQSAVREFGQRKLPFSLTFYVFI